MSVSRRFLLGLSGVSLLGAGRLAACGDKLLHYRGGLRFQRAFAAARKASILISLGKDKSAPSLRDEKFLSALKSVGHKVTVAGDPAAAQSALRSAKFDVVLSGISDTPGLTSSVSSAAGKPTLIPVMYRPAKQEYQAVNRKYAYLMRLPGSPAKNLTLIDKAMKSRISRSDS